MAGIFSPEGKVFEALDKAVNCIILSVLWVVTSVPIITMGASTTALYYSINKSVRHGRGYAVREYLSAFRSNFKQATLTWLLFLLFAFIFGVDAWVTRAYYREKELVGGFYILFLAFLFLEFILAIYVFPYMARFEDGIKMTIRNSALMAVGSFPKTLLLVLITGILMYICYLFPFFTMIMPAWICNWWNRILEKVFRLYMSEGDKEREDALNNEYPDNM